MEPASELEENMGGLNANRKAATRHSIMGPEGVFQNSARSAHSFLVLVSPRHRRRRAITRRPPMCGDRKLSAS